jgi:4-hydroxy-2-oxoglutarate aldolase
LSKNLHGVFCPLTTPFSPDGSLDLEGLARNVDMYAKTGVSGHLILGSNGENKSLRWREKLDVIKTVMAHIGKEQTAMTASIFESTVETIEFAKEAEKLGADYITLLPPSYFKKNMTDSALVKYFTDVASAIKTPCLLYNAPQFAGTLSISEKVLKECANHPNIKGVKDSSGNIFKTLLAIDGVQDFIVMSGSADTFFGAMQLGAVGGIVSLANSLPERSVELYRLATAGDYENAIKLNRDILKANRGVSGKYGVAGVKAAMDFCGYVGGSPRLPLLPLSEEDRESIRRVVETFVC